MIADSTYLPSPSAPAHHVGWAGMSGRGLHFLPGVEDAGEFPARLVTLDNPSLSPVVRVTRFWTRRASEEFRRLAFPARR